MAGVIITTTNRCLKDNLHAEAVADFSALGYHILCEKPMATSIADCVQMFKNVTEVLEPKIFGMGHGRCQNLLLFE